jgi:hypothetical protein
MLRTGTDAPCRLSAALTEEKKDQGYLIGTLPFGYRRPAQDNTKDAGGDREILLTSDRENSPR